MEETYPERVTMRDGTQVTVRLLEQADERMLHEFFCALPEEDRLFLEDDVSQPEFVARFVRRVSSHRVFAIVAETEGRIVGCGTLYRTSHGWTKHVGDIRVAVARMMQRKGLGTVLAHDLVRHAIGLGLDKLTADVVENQVGAKRAFERLGFHPEAVLKGHVRDIHGMRRDLVIMANDVSQIWETMEAMQSDFLPTGG